MKKVQLIMVMLFALVTVFYCNGSKNETSTVEEKVQNSGVVLVKNGKDEIDTIPFTCIGCSEYLTMSQFNDIVDKSIKLTKENLKYPLSFIPKELEITIIKEDSLYLVSGKKLDNTFTSFIILRRKLLWYLVSDKKLDNTFTVITSSKYIVKNGYGNELEGEGLVSFYLVNDEIKDVKKP